LWNDWQGKPKYSEKTCPNAALSNTNPTYCPDANPCRRGGKPATNRLSYGMATLVTLTWRPCNRCKHQKCSDRWSAEIFKNVQLIIMHNTKCSCLKHYATSRKIAGSISDEVIVFFNWSNLSSRAMILRSAQPLAEISIRNLPGVKGWPAHKADLTAICEPIV
jgi:hypothetical protein